MSIYIYIQITKVVNNVCEVINIYTLTNSFSLWDIIRHICLSIYTLPLPGKEVCPIVEIYKSTFIHNFTDRKKSETD